MGYSAQPNILPRSPERGYMDTDRIKLEARLFASEYLLCNLYAMLFRGSADAAASTEAFAAEVRNHMAGFTVPDSNRCSRISSPPRCVTPWKS